METQIICFIDPTKFFNLLGVTKAERIGFTSKTNSLIGYIDYHWNIEFFTYNLEKANKAYILIVPDSFNLNYVPMIPFEVLYHELTNRELVNSLRRLDNCQGYKESHESLGTIYDSIAQSIKVN